MKIPEEHKKLLREMGLRDEDFGLFDGKSVSYEFDESKGVRLHDPYYRTSYREYMDVEGWSSWSSEGDDFMSTVLKGAAKEMERKMRLSEKPSQEEIAGAMKKKFRKKAS